MTALVSLHNEAHQHLRVNTQIAEAQGANLNMVPVMLSEFLKVAVQFPIAITKNKDTGRFVCVALFGFTPNENLFYNNQQWESVYLPLQIVRQPFFLGENSESSSADDQYVICVDTSSPSLQATDGEPLFTAEGQATNYLEKMKYVLAELLDGETKTQAFIDQLIALKLLQPMQLQITFDNGETNNIEGTYSIDENRLQALTQTEVFNLHQLGYLGSIQSMLVSLGHIYGMVDKKNKRLAQATI